MRNQKIFSYADIGFSLSINYELAILRGHEIGWRPTVAPGSRWTRSGYHPTGKKELPEANGKHGGEQESSPDVWREAQS